MTNNQTPGDGGISEPKVYGTVEEAGAAPTAEEVYIRKTYNMTPEEYWAWRENAANSNPEDME